MLKVSAFKWVPAPIQGLVRDVRVRWALEEAGLPYEERLLNFEELKTPEYRKLQPFNQVPSLEDDGTSLFESGAIVLYLAERSDALQPRDARGRAQVTTWVVAALNSVEPYVAGLVDIDFFNPKEEWAKLRRPAVVTMLKDRLRQLSDYMEGRDYLAERFSAADIIMTTVLRDVPHDILSEQPTLVAYRQRCEARPAFQRALAAHMAPFKRFAPGGRV